MERRFGSVVVALFLVSGIARADITSGIVNILVDGGNSYPWQQIELPGTVCGDGSQYRFYFYDSGSKNVVFYFEGGGACWDYDTCSGRAGVLGAAHPNGIPTNYMTSFQPKYVSPIVNGADPGIPFRSRTDLITKGWSMVYLPYCTGDVHLGNNVKTYVDPTGAQPPLTWHHAGYTNTLAAIDYVKSRMPSVQKLLVSGFSAGGVATSAAFYFVRRALKPQRGYLLNDSGPIFYAPNLSSLSRPLHDKIRSSWALDSVFATLPPTFDTNDFGSINRMVSLEFPQDQLAYTGYSRDYNFSRFSYERFRSPNDKESVLSYWKTDQTALVAQLSQLPNWSYFIPWERQINSSHCSTIITFIGSHACQNMQKKTGLWWLFSTQPWECKSEFVPMETFLARFVGNGTVTRIVEPENGYNANDVGMQIVAPLLNAAAGL
ncbi:MAG: pectin acetylesterase-family hydrolase [Myxococcota bacterium]